MKALSPLVVFLVLYLVTSIVAQDFYKVPIAVAFLVSSVYSLLTVKGTMNERIGIFAKGAGNPTMVLMLAIFILAGAFAASAKTMGAVDATVNLALNYLPEKIHAQRVLEINPDHEIFGKLKSLSEGGDKEKIGKYAKLLYDQALLIEGMSIEDPVEFSNLICELM